MTYTSSTEYMRLHKWVRQSLGKPSKCEHCGMTDTFRRYEWANISRAYKWDLSDWKRLCKSCHTLFDGVGGNGGHRHTPTTRARMSASHTGVKRPYIKTSWTNHTCQQCGLVRRVKAWKRYTDRKYCSLVCAGGQS